MMKNVVRLIVLSWLCVAGLNDAAWGQLPTFPGTGGAGSKTAAAESDKRVEASLVWKDGHVVPGTQAMLGVLLDISPGWHMQAGQGSGDEIEPYIATTIEVALPNGWTAEKPRWPEAHAFTMGTGEAAEQLRGYEGRILIVVPINVPANAATGEVSIGVKVDYQACNDRACEFPTAEEVTGKANVGDTASRGALPDLATTKLFEEVLSRKAASGSSPMGSGGGSSIRAQTFGGLLILLLLAMLGGFILNFTPCVLPVIPLKIMGLAQSAGNRSRTFALGVAMSCGVIAFWMGLGVAVATISGLSTNQLFQFPLFTLGVGVIIALMAVGMCGLFSIRLPNFVYAINPSHDSFVGSFGFGIMTAILSTPCTAPFMGTAIAASVGQSIFIVLSVFAAIGIGMALPYLILAANPRWIDRMPRTGPASELIKQVMGFLMLAVAAYFLGIGLSGMLAGEGQPPSKMYWWFVAIFLCIAGAWLVYRTVRITSSTPRRAIFAGLGVAMIAGSIYGGSVLTAKGPIDWVYYTPERLDKELAKGNVVVLKFTAEWCANCHFLEHTVIDTAPVVKSLKRDGVTPMKVDITNKKAAGNGLLVQYWRSIPYLVVMRPDRSVAFQADWYTPTQVVDGVNEALNTHVARGKP